MALGLPQKRNFDLGPILVMCTALNVRHTASTVQVARDLWIVLSAQTLTPPPQCLEMFVDDQKTLGDRWARTENRSARTLVVWPARVTPGSDFAPILATGPCIILLVRSSGACVERFCGCAPPACLSTLWCQWTTSERMIMWKRNTGN